jgi:hypothetical protein
MMPTKLIKEGSQEEKLAYIAKERPASYFQEFAKMVPLTQEQWDRFWKLVRREQLNLADN